MANTWMLNMYAFSLSVYLQDVTEALTQQKLKVTDENEFNRVDEIMKQMEIYSVLL